MTRNSKSPAWVAARRRLNFRSDYEARQARIKQGLPPEPPAKPTKKYDMVKHTQSVDRHAQHYAATEPAKPTEKEQIAEAKHRASALQSAALAAEIRRQRALGDAFNLQEALDEVRGGSLTLPAAVAQGDLTKISMALWAQNVMVLSDLAKTAPMLEIRMEAADRAAQRAQVMLNMIAGSGNSPLRGPRVVDMAPEETAAGELAMLSREEKIALVRKTLMSADGNGNGNA